VIRDWWISAPIHRCGRHEFWGFYTHKKSQIDVLLHGIQDGGDPSLSVINVRRARTDNRGLSPHKKIKHT